MCVSAVPVDTMATWQACVASEENKRKRFTGSRDSFRARARQMMNAKGRAARCVCRFVSGPRWLEIEEVYGRGKARLLPPGCGVYRWTGRSAVSMGI